MYFYVQFTLNLSYNGIEIMINPDSSDMIELIIWHLLNMHGNACALWECDNLLMLAKG